MLLTRQELAALVWAVKHTGGPHLARHRCRVEYRAPGRDAPKRFPHDPYRLLFLQSGMYCIGKVPPYANLVTLAVDRIRTIALTDERFAPDPGFDPKRHEAEAFGIVWERPMHVVVRFRADQAPYVREREWHPSQRFGTLRDGRLELRVHAGGTLEIARPGSRRRGGAAGQPPPARPGRARLGARRLPACALPSHSPGVGSSAGGTERLTGQPDCLIVLVRTYPDAPASG